MKEQNGDDKQKNVNIQYTPSDNIFNKSSIEETNITNEIKIEDILDNDDYINSLKTNSNSKFRKILTTKNIIKLIHYCLLPKEEKNLKNELKIEIRYAYYSCQILCSHCVLHFSKSIKYISKANNLSLTKEMIENSKNDSLSGEILINNYSNKTEDINFQNPINDDYFEQMNLNERVNTEIENNDYFHFDDYLNSIDEKYVSITETEFHKNTKNNKPISEYDKQDKKIIEDILNEIFRMLDIIKKEDYTYIGYFQKIINYILFIEKDILIRYTFRGKNPKINNLYYHLDKYALVNIFENILNILLDEYKKEDEKDTIDYKDKEKDKDKDKDNKDEKKKQDEEMKQDDEDKKSGKYYNKIIQDILKELIINNNCEKTENICELIINTLINNNEKQLIEFAFNDNNNNMIVILLNYIEMIINNKNKENNNFLKNNNLNNEKLIIGILQILCQLNNVIMNTFFESSYFRKKNKYIDFFIDNYKKINTFEYQYIPKNVISMTKIFEAYNDNNLFYLSTLNDIYNLIILDIIQKYKEIKYNNNSDNSIIIKHNYNKNNQQFGLFHLYEWKFVLSSLKIYIYSFFAIEGLESEDLKYFENEELFIILIKLYFYFPQNNIYHNIFIEIIKLICNERCPEYLIQPFLRIDENTHQNKFINKLINNLKTNLNEKHKLLVGTNIEVLKIFYSSYNPTIKKHFETSELDNNFKDIFDDLIIPKLKRQLLDDYEYDDSEIFNNYNDNNRTFDGNDIDLERNYNSFLTSVQKFIEKVENEKKEFINNNNNTMKEGLKINKKKIKQINQKNKIEDYQNICKEERTIIDNEDEENHFSSETSIVMTLND